MKFKDIKSTYTEEKKISDFNNHLFLFYTYRPISFLITHLFLRLKISANTVTYFTFIFGPILIMTLFMENFIGSLIAFFSSILFYTFDCVDGNMARIKRKDSRFGEFLDSFSGITFSFFVHLFFSLKSMDQQFWIQLIPITSFSFILISRYYSLRFLKNNNYTSYKFSLKTIMKSFPDLYPFLILMTFYISEYSIIFLVGGYNFLALVYIINKTLKTT